MIKVRGLHKSFGSNYVIKGLDIDVQEGETVVILGRSGVGKSVLLKHIIGILKPDQGTVEVDGQMISDLKSHELYRAIKDMGMLFQGAALFDSMNIGENTGFYLRQHGDIKTGKRLSQKEVNIRVGEALEMVGLEGTEDKLPSDLSGGMRKRAGLARLIVYRPRILLYDEPTTGLDPVTAMQINHLINQIKQELNATSIVVTHDIRSALEVGDKYAFHNEGKIAHLADFETFVRIQDPALQAFFDNAIINEDTVPEFKHKRGPKHD